MPSAGPDPEYTQEQREEFNGRSWIGVEDRSLLDVAGTELLLVGAKDKPIETGGWLSCFSHWVETHYLGWSLTGELSRHKQKCPLTASPARIDYINLAGCCWHL